jgi:glucokinase
VIATDALVLAVDIGGTTIKAEISDAAGAVVTAAAQPTPHGSPALDLAGRMGETLLARLSACERERVRRAAVIMPGIVDAARGVAVFSANIGWRDVEAGDQFRRRWGMPVLLDHDSTVAGWAEWRAAGQGAANACVVIIGTGIAGVLAVDGRLVRGGGRGQAGEYGHIPVRPDGARCPCGNIGCVETVASATAIARAYARRRGYPVAGAAEVAALLDTDPVARSVWAEAVDALADGLIGIIHATCPDVLVLGGGLAQAGTALTDPLHAALAGKLVLVTPPEVLIGKYGARAGLAGAALLARLGSRSDGTV